SGGRGLRSVPTRRSSDLSASTPGLLIDLTSIAEVADDSSDTIRAEAGARISALNGVVAPSGHEILADLPLDRIEAGATLGGMIRSEEHTSELQSRFDLVC